MSDINNDIKVTEPVNQVSQPAPATAPVPTAVPLDRVVASIAADSLKNTKEYLKATVTPGGGE